jgi:hypothetical protein
MPDRKSLRREKIWAIKQNMSQVMEKASHLLEDQMRFTYTIPKPVKA